MITKKLDDLFASYERRKRSEEKAAADKAAHEQRERDGALRVFREKLVPPLRAMSDALRERGHEASVAEMLADEFPHVVIEFTPAPRANGAPPIKSQVVFAYKGGETVETVQEIARSASRGITEKWRLVDVTEDWVNRQALSLVESALRNH